VTGDVVSVLGLRGRGRHGWLASELAEGQDFVVDVEMTVDTSAAGRSDDLADTVDYAAVASTVVAIIQGDPVRLIETLAQRIADSCLADQRVEQVTVTVHKPQAPLTVPFSDVTVSIVRGRR